MISDKELREAARQYEKARLRALPEPGDCQAVFSPDFERSMKKLIFRTDHPIRYWLPRLLGALLTAGLAAGLAAAVILSAKQAGVPPTYPEASAAEPSEPQASEPQASESAARAAAYRPTWLPEGCAWAREALYENEGMIVYRTPGGGEAVFLYDLTGAGLDAQGTAVPVGDGTGMLLLGQNKEELNELFWADEATGASFWLSAPFQEDDLIRVAERVAAAQ